MTKSVYEWMDWERIEAIVYTEENSPRQILGPRVTDSGILICCYFPDSEQVRVKILEDNTEYQMEQQDEAGFYGVLIPGNEIPAYQYIVTKGESSFEAYDAYAFDNQITHEEERKMLAGVCFDGFEKLGAHIMCLNGIQGVYFAVWAPNAMRVSVVGTFNNWDGRVYQMNRLATTGIYELFIPSVKEGDLYKFEIKSKNGEIFLKSDPYAFYGEVRPDNASVVANITNFKWNDQEFLQGRTTKQSVDNPMFIYELHMGSWKRPKDKEFYTYKELAPLLIDYVKEMGYTHVELMPVMEHPYDPSWGYQVTGYYAPTSRYGTCEEFMYFIDALHQADIGVILDWVPAHFPRDAHGLARFDGTCLYEHEDPRKGAHPHWGTLIYNYGSPFVTEFLIGNALFWSKYYHVDGIRIDAVASMLYLDYGRNQGEWVPNVYGGHENLEAIEFLRQLNSAVKKRYPDILLIAEESTAWPKVTSTIKEHGLGFDYKWNMGWMNDFIQYMSLDPLYRGGQHQKLIFSMDYHYSEQFFLSLSHDEVVHGKGTLLTKMPGTLEEKFANLRLAFGFMIAHPGKKLLFMGQDFGQTKEWDFNGELSWGQLEETNQQQMMEYSKALIEVYKAYPALYELDYEVEGFEWINHLDSERSILTFLRKTKLQQETLLVVCNFSALSYEAHQVGVPYHGKYKEIFNSDNKKFGGSGIINPRVKTSKKVECDGRSHSINIKVAPLGISIFTYAKVPEKLVEQKTTKAKGKGKAKGVTKKKE